MLAPGLQERAGRPVSRGHRLDGHEVLSARGKEQVVLLNNINSFTTSRERAGEFGDYILSASIPSAKVFFHAELLPGVLRGEGEHLVIGGVYAVRIETL
jgi:Dinitrogenase reductase ADP-ribosyltransferase (DRAT).